MGKRGIRMWKVFFTLAIIWWTWRIEEDTTEAATVIHLIFLFSSLMGLILIEIFYVEKMKIT